MIKLISVWVKCPICGWNEAGEKIYKEMRQQETADKNEFIQMLCDLYEFDKKTMHVISTELFEEGLQKCSFSIKSKVQVEHPEINQAELEVRLVVQVCKD